MIFIASWLAAIAFLAVNLTLGHWLTAGICAAGVALTTALLRKEMKGTW